MNTLNINSLTSSSVLNPTRLVSMDFQVKNPLVLHTGDAVTFVGNAFAKINIYTHFVIIITSWMGSYRKRNKWPMNHIAHLRNKHIFAKLCVYRHVD